MARIEIVPEEDMNADQRRVHDAIVSGPRGKVEGPLAVWLHRPGLAERAQALGQYARYDSALPPRLSELAILATARVWGAEFEWWAHKPIAVSRGISEDIAQAIRNNEEPSFEQADEALVYRFAVTLHRERKVSDELYAQAVRILGQDQVIDLVGVLGYYTLISMTINVFEVDIPDGSPPQLS